MVYGVLLGVYRSQAGVVECLVQGFQQLQSNDSVTHIVNEYNCPLLDLSRTIFTTPGRNIQHTVSIVHECGTSCCFKQTNTVQNIERQEITRTNLTFDHDWSNTLYSYNVYCAL